MTSKKNKKNQNIERYEVNASSGLSQVQVASRVSQGATNVTPSRVTKSTWSIFRDYVFTLFNFFNVGIGVALAVAGHFSSLLFLAVVVLNIVIGLIQEFRGRALVNKLTVVLADKVKVRRNGKVVEIVTDELVLDDVLELSSGEQVAADSIVLEGELEVNEALLTGESELIIKKVGDMLLSGSFVVSGKASVRVDKVGLDGFAAKLIKDAKKDKKQSSELIASMNKITRLTSLFIIPIGVMLFVQAMFTHAVPLSWQAAVPVTSAALLGMLPRGLVLLVSIALATGVIKLSKKNVLVQDLYATETLARVSILCLDKTGTITEGKMKVDKFTELETSKKFPLSHRELIELFLAFTDDNNLTANALREFFVGDSQNERSSNISQLKQKYSCIVKTAFSASRKFSSVTIDGIGTITIGAPEKLQAVHTGKAISFKASNKLNRVIFIGFSTISTNQEKNDNPYKLEVFSTIELNDPIRKNARQTLQFFKNNGVAIKVISGDNAQTVSHIALAAGLENGDKFIDMSLVQTDAELENAAKHYTVFGRVSPEQKKKLIIAFKQIEKISKGKRTGFFSMFFNGRQKQKHRVAMVGDGVNDVLALREADCGIALASGSSASKQVSSIVLLNSDFTHLPMVVAEGRRVVNTITKAGGIFFIKTIYTVILSVLLIILNMPFPFIPVQITFIDLAIEGFPSFFLTFENETKPIKGEFVNTAFMRALPNAIMVVVVTSVMFIVGRVTAINQEILFSIAFIALGFISACAAIRACVPFKKENGKWNKLRIFLASFTMIGFFLAVWLFSYGITRILGLYEPFNFLYLNLPLQYLWIAIVLSLGALPFLILLSMWIKPKHERRQKLLH